MNQKRNRSINWGEEEKQLLRFVLKEYAQVIENKSLDTNTNKMKTKAWEEVHKKFNQLNCRPRDLSQLKIQWKGMKMNARKTCSNFKKEVNRTGGGARPTTPNDAIIEVKDLLNPAELLRDQNVFDSDGIIIEEVEMITSNEAGPVKLQKIYDIETLEDIEAQGAVQDTPLAISQDDTSAAIPMEKYMDSLPVQNSEDEIRMTTPPFRKSNKKTIGSGTKRRKNSEDEITTTTPPFRKSNKKTIGSGTKRRKEQDDYVSSMLSHSKMLKDEEHMRRMEMAEEEHTIKMAIHKENLKFAIRLMEMAEEEHSIKMAQKKEGKF